MNSLEDRAALGLVGPFTRIARAMSQKWNVRVVPAGNSCASTDEETIYIPFVSDKLPQDKLRILHGLLDHEIMHVAEAREHKQAGLLTLVEIFRKTENRPHRSKLNWLANIFEDVRIEEKYTKKYLGVLENIHAIREWGFTLTARDEFWTQLGRGLLSIAYGFEPKCPDHVREYVDLVTPELFEARDAGTSQEVFVCAERALKKILDKAQEEQQGQSSGFSEEDSQDGGSEEGPEQDSDEERNSEQGSEEEQNSEQDSDEEEGSEEGPEQDSEQDSEEEQGSEEGSEQDSEEGSEEGSEQGSEEGSEEGQGSEEGEGEEGEEGDEEAPDDIRQNIAEEILKEDSEGEEIEEPVEAAKRGLREFVEEFVENNGLYVPSLKSKEGDVWFVPRDGDLQVYRTAREDVLKQIGALRGRQIAYLQTISRKKLVSGLDSGSIDDSSLPLVASGEKNVFFDVVKGIELDTAVQVLLDLSGSTGDNTSKWSPAYYCLRTAIALSESWESLRIPYEIVGFRNDVTPYRVYRSEEGGAVERAPFHFLIFKGWGEKLARCRARFSNIEGGGFNVDGEAVLAAASRLSLRKEKRKILIVINDGYPNHPCIDNKILNNHLEEVVRTVVRSGIQVLGVGAGTDAPAQFYNKRNGASYLCVRDLNRLAVNLFKVFGKMLRV